LFCDFFHCSWCAVESHILFLLSFIRERRDCTLDFIDVSPASMMITKSS